MYDIKNIYRIGKEYITSNYSQYLLLEDDVLGKLGNY